MFNASSKLALALAVIVGISASASAQGFVGTPMAGSAGAGNSAINGIPPGRRTLACAVIQAACEIPLEWLRPGRHPSAYRGYRAFIDFDRTRSAAPMRSASTSLSAEAPLGWKS